MSFSELWEKITIVISIPIAFGFVTLGVFGQLCLDNLPYLTC